MDERKRLLITTARRLVYLGAKVEAARARLKALVGQGAAYDSPKMSKAYQDYLSLNEQWNEAEQSYLKIKAEINNSR